MDFHRAAQPAFFWDPTKGHCGSEFCHRPPAVFIFISYISMVCSNTHRVSLPPFLHTHTTACASAAHMLIWATALTNGHVPKEIRKDILQVLGDLTLAFLVKISHLKSVGNSTVGSL